MKKRERVKVGEAWAVRRDDGAWLDSRGRWDPDREYRGLFEQKRASFLAPLRGARIVRVTFYEVRRG